MQGITLQDYGSAVFSEWRHHDIDRTWDAESDTDSDEEVPWNQWRGVATKCLWSELKLKELADFLNVLTDMPIP